jgi:hypothetical protein
MTQNRLQQSALLACGAGSVVLYKAPHLLIQHLDTRRDGINLMNNKVSCWYIYTCFESPTCFALCMKNIACSVLWYWRWLLNLWPRSIWTFVSFETGLNQRKQVVFRGQKQQRYIITTLHLNTWINVFSSYMHLGFKMYIVIGILQVAPGWF